MNATTSSPIPHEAGDDAIDKRRVADQAYDAIENLIATLALKPGAPIVEAELIERIGMGRTPTREALLGCAAEMTTAAAAGDLSAYLQADQALDHVNHAACRNQAAVAAVIPMVIQCRRFWTAYQHQGDMSEGARCHQLLAEAIAQGQSEAAAAAADQLMDYLRQFAQQVIA